MASKKVSGDASSAEGDDSDEGVRDALPRLTRSQHRLIFTDAPPTATLPTAVPTLRRESADEEHLLAPSTSHEESTRKPVGTRRPSAMKATTTPSKKVAVAKIAGECEEPMEKSPPAHPPTTTPTRSDEIGLMEGICALWSSETVEMPK